MRRFVVGMRHGWILLIALGWAMGCTIPPKAPLPATRFTGLTRVACIGDSITAGSGLTNPAETSYPAVLSGLLGPAYRVRNFGVSGATLLRDGDLPYTGTPEFRDALDFRPHVVVIALGTNDSKPQNWLHADSFERDLYRLVRAFQSLPSRPVVYLATPPPVFHDRWGITEDIVRLQIVPRLRSIAAREGWSVIDWNSLLRDDPSVFPDGIHPDALGAARLAAHVGAVFRGR